MTDVHAHERNIRRDIKMIGRGGEFVRKVIRNRLGDTVKSKRRMIRLRRFRIEKMQFSLIGARRHGDQVLFAVGRNEGDEFLHRDDLVVTVFILTKNTRFIAPIIACVQNVFDTADGVIIIELVRHHELIVKNGDHARETAIRIIPILQSIDLVVCILICHKLLQMRIRGDDGDALFASRTRATAQYAKEQGKC